MASSTEAAADEFALNVHLRNLDTSGQRAALRAANRIRDVEVRFILGEDFSHMLKAVRIVLVQSFLKVAAGQRAQDDEWRARAQ